MIKFREANLDDISTYFIWVNDPLVRSISFITNNVTLREHKKWFKSKIKDENCLMLLFTVSNNPIGQVRFKKENGNHAVINISVSNEFRGKGYGSEILKMATTHFFNINPEVIINAYIKTSNISSVKSFEKASFKRSTILNYKGFEGFNYKLENENK
jgi:RimJ/RimL family protein N-acetyltransferase